MLLGAFVLGFLLARALAAKDRVRLTSKRDQDSSTEKGSSAHSDNPLVSASSADANRIAARDESEIAAVETRTPHQATPTAVIASASSPHGEAQSESLTVATTPKPDDLKRIEGIGPKIEQILHKAGITNFAQLAEREEQALREMLMTHNPRLRTHDTSTWPVQAALARDGEWEKLNTMQKKAPKKNK